MRFIRSIIISVSSLISPGTVTALRTLCTRRSVLEVAAITAALVQADPEHAAVYKKNSEAYQEKLLQPTAASKTIPNITTKNFFILTSYKLPQLKFIIKQ